MMRYVLISMFLGLILMCMSAESQQYADINVSVLDNPEPGYLFLAPYSSRFLVILDNRGGPVFTKDFGMMSDYLDFKYVNNKLWVCNNIRSKFYCLDNNMNVIDSFACTTPYSTDFHDIRPMSNGHVLMLGTDTRTVDMSKVVTNGNPTARVMGSVIQEFDENHNLVFEWNSFDHIDITDATPDVDLASPNFRFTHSNSIEVDYDGNILLSSRHLDEITKINRTNGAIMWRMGGSMCRNNQFRFVNDTVNGFFGFSHQHDVRRLSNGNILLFDNGNLKTPTYSRVVEYQVDEVNKTVTKVWEFRNSPDIYSYSMGSAQRLPNGNTMVGWGDNDDNIIIVEVRPDGTKAYEAITNKFVSYRAYRFKFRMAALTHNITSTGTYNFNEAGNETFVSMNISGVGSPGKITVEKHDYEARNLSFDVANPKVVYKYRWMVTKTGNPSVSGNITFDLSTLSGIPDPSKVLLYKRTNEGSGMFTLISSTYNAETQDLSATFAGLGEYILCSNYMPVPELSSPDNNSTGKPLDIALKWKTATGASSYHLEVWENQDFSGIAIVDTNQEKIEYKCLNLKENQKYYWRVRARYFGGYSSWSEVRTFTTILSPPELIKPANNAKGEGSTTVFEWSEVYSATNYRLQVCEDSLFNVNTVDQSSLKAVEFKAENLKSKAKYYWRVNASNAGGTSRWSQVRTFDTKYYPPDLLLPLNNAAGVAESGVLEWIKVNGADYYRIQIDDNRDFITPLLDSSGLTGLKASYKNFENNKHYFWRVRAVCNGEKTEWSEIRAFTIVVGKPRLVFPENGAIKQSINGSLVWNAVTGAKIYRVEISSDSAFTSLVYHKDSIGSSSLQYTNLEYNRLFYWRVYAHDTSGNGNWSSIFSFKTKFNSAFNIPSLVYPEDNTAPYALTDRLEWNPITGVDYYNIEISTDPAFINNVKTLKSNNSVTSPPALANFTEYYWRVQAVFPAGESDWSQTRKFRTIIGVPVIISPVDGADDFKPADALTWEHVKGAITYNVQVSEFSDFQDNLYDLSDLTESNLSLKNLKTKTLYYWRVMAVRNNEISGWSQAFRFTTSDYTSAEENLDEANISYINFYPNPSINMSVIELELKAESYVNLRIYSETGSLVETIFDGNMQSGHYSFGWESGKYASGIYSYILTCGRTIQKGKIVNLK